MAAIIRRLEGGWIAPLLLAIATFTLYATMAARDVMFGDGPELTAAAITNGVAHPPGYPLWVMLAHAATLVPAGSLPFRVNLFSALVHALTVGVVYASGLTLTRNSRAAFFGAVALAIGSPIFTSWSLQAEVFPLNDLFGALIILVSLLWLKRPAQYRLAIVLGALFGLGLANHQMLILLAPVPLLAAFFNRRALSPRTWFVVAVCAFAAFFAGFALPYVHAIAASQNLPRWHFGAARSFSELIDLIDRKAYGSFNLVPHEVDRGASFFARLYALVEAGGYPLYTALAGTVAMIAARRLSDASIPIVIVALPFLGFCAIAGVNVEDESLRSIFQRFGLLSLAAIAPFSACLYAAVETLLVARTAKPAAAIAVTAAVAVASLVPAMLRLPSLSLADVHEPRNLYRDVAAALPKNAILMTAGDSVDTPPQYFSVVEQWRPDVTVVTFGLLNLRHYRESLGGDITVPEAVAAPIAPQAERDILATANASRPFFVIGERPLHAPGPRYHALPTGVVSQLVLNNGAVNAAAHFRAETALQSTPGYGRIDPERWKSNGFGSTVREYYAGGFFSTGYDAEQLGDRAAALYWYRAAAAYTSSPLIDEQLRRLGGSAGQTGQ